MSDDSALASLSVCIDQPLTAEGGAGGYVGRIIDVTPGRAPEEQVREDIVIPLGADQAHTVPIKPGEYIVEAISPSGELLDRRVSIESGEAVVRLEERARLGKELGWQVVSGNIDRVRVAAETAADEGVRQAQRTIAQARSFWQRLGWARPLLVALAIALAAGALLLRTGGPRVESTSSNTIAAAEEVGMDYNASEMLAENVAASEMEAAPANAVGPIERLDENATASMELEAASGRMLPADPEASALNMTYADGSAPVVRYRHRTIRRDAESAEENAAATAEAPPPPPPPEQAGPAEVNAPATATATATATAPSVPKVKAQATAPEEITAALEQPPLLWSILLAVAAILALGFVFTRWVRPKEIAIEETPVAAAAEAAAVLPGAIPAFPATLFRAPPGAASWAVLDAAEQGLPAVCALLAPIAAKADLPGRDCEGFRMHDVAPGLVPAGGAADGPLFALVPAAGSAGELVAVPMPWALQNGGEAGFEIASSTCPTSSFSASATIKDAEAATILGYMAAGRLQQAELIVRSAEEMLNFKYRNPLAATLGAYVLVSSCVDRGGGAAWRPWIGNLYADFPWLPDAAILQGWNLLQQQQDQADLGRARDCLVEAAERGIPIFSEGVRLLQSGLAMFGGTSAGQSVKKAIARVDRLALRCSPAQAFTTIRVSVGP